MQIFERSTTYNTEYGGRFETIVSNKSLLTRKLLPRSSVVPEKGSPASLLSALDTYSNRVGFPDGNFFFPAGMFHERD